MNETVALGYTTVANEKQARVLADKLLESGCVACVQWVPIESLYYFKGKKCLEKEIRLTLKFLTRHAPSARKMLGSPPPL